MPLNSRIRQQQLRRKIQWAAWALIFGLFIAGVTAFPLQRELDVLAQWFGGGSSDPSRTSSFLHWVILVRNALHDVYMKYPFFGYGTDWLGFAHIAIAVAYIGVLRHPLRNSWLFTWGKIMCVLVIPFALIAGEVRGIPVGWRMIDCAFGVIGLIPCWLGARWCNELERLKIAESSRSNIDEGTDRIQKFGEHL
jgi:hypothetical protein